MALQAVTANTDLTGPNKPKRLANWHFSNSVAAAVINLRNGSVTGTRLIQIQLAIGASASQAYSVGMAPVFPDGLFVEIVSGTVIGSVDVV